MEKCIDYYLTLKMILWPFGNSVIGCRDVAYLSRNALSRFPPDLTEYPASQKRTPTMTPTTATDPPSYVTLVSSDGHEFIIARDAANVAGTLKRMLDPQSM